MPIEINPNLINRPSSSGKAGERKLQQPATSSPYVTPARSEINHIPSNESLFTLINSAVAALRQGVRWDRGTILNLVV